MTRVETRLATLERQLARYLASPLPPAALPAQAARRMTYQRYVVRNFLRQMRCLRTQGNAIGWRQIALTAEEEARLASLLPTMEARALGRPVCTG